MRAVTILAAVVVTGLAAVVRDASAECGWCTPRCERANYSECSEYCDATAVMDCWCEEAPSSCAWVTKDLGPDGAVYVRVDVTPRMRPGQDGKHAFVACDGAILAREYAGLALDRAHGVTATITI